jgi:hypothetical protein
MTKLKVDDLVRVIQSQGGMGPTLYVITWIGDGGRCAIREAGNPRAGEQSFDLSLLRKVKR